MDDDTDTRVRLSTAPLGAPTFSTQLPAQPSRRPRRLPKRTAGYEHLHLPTSTGRVALRASHRKANRRASFVGQDGVPSG